MFVDFAGCCLDQILNQAAKFRYMFGGKAVTPLVIRTMVGAGLRAAAQHSQMLTSLWTHIPGLKVVCPSSPYDAKGLLVQAIRDNDPVIFCEHKLLYSMQGEVPEELYSVPFGEANFLRDGDDVTLVTYGRMVHLALDAAASLARQGISCEVLDLRSTSPLDEDSILESVEKTGRLVVVDEANPRCSMATDIAALVAERASPRCARRSAGSPRPIRRCLSPTPWKTSTSPTRRRSRQPCARPWKGGTRHEPDPYTDHAQVGPVDDRGSGGRLAQGRGRAYRERRRGARRGDRQDLQQRRGALLGRAAAQGGARGRDPGGRRAARRGGRGRGERRGDRRTGATLPGRIRTRRRGRWR